MKKEKIGINITVSILIILVSVLLYFLIREELFSTDIVANIIAFLYPKCSLGYRCRDVFWPYSGRHI
jgi:hypothetical protein